MKKLLFFLVFLVFCSAIYFLSFEAKQNDFIPLFTSFSIAFACYYYFYLNRNLFKFKTWLWFFMIVILIPFLGPSNLSPDVYRFIWDGDIQLQGFNPFSYAPNDLINNVDFQWTERLKEAYENGMTDLSKKHFSVYPTVNQFYFHVSAYFTNDIFSFFLVLRTLMILTFGLGLIFTVRLMDFLSIPRTKSLLIVLNPLFIIECLANFHFEGIMMSFLIIGLYYIVKKQWLKGAIFWAFAINVKLTPLLLLPFCWKFLKLKKTALFYGATLFWTTVILFIVVWPSLFLHFWESISLYFNNFEFNSSLFQVVSFFFSAQVEGNPIPIFGPILSKIALVVILLMALFNPSSTAKSMFTYMLFGYVAYLLLSTTVHPWYVIVPMVLSLFTKYMFVFFWSYFVTFSYVFYDSSIDLYMIMTFGYLLTFSILGYEMLTKPNLLANRTKG